MTNTGVCWVVERRLIRATGNTLTYRPYALFYTKPSAVDEARLLRLEQPTHRFRVAKYARVTP